MTDSTKCFLTLGWKTVRFELTVFNDSMHLSLILIINPNSSYNLSKENSNLLPTNLYAMLERDVKFVRDAGI